MAQYPRFEMPRATDPMASLMDIVRLMQTGEANQRAKKDQAYQDEDRARANADRAALDSALSPQTAQASAEGYTGAPGTWQGPVDARNPPAPLDRNQVLSQAAGHLRPVLQKYFDDADEHGRQSQISLLALQEAQEKATVRMNDYLGDLAVDVIQFRGDPKATRLAFDHTLSTYEQFPEIRKRIAASAEKVSDDPAHNMALAHGLAGKSKPARERLEKLGDKNELDLARTAATAVLPDGTPDHVARAEALATMGILVRHNQAKNAPTVKAPEVGTFSDYVTRKYGQSPTPEDVVKARKEYGQADDRARIDVNVGQPDNIKEAIAGMKDGTIPPQMPGRASKDYTAVMAEAHRQGYDLAQAVTDWTATQKHVNTLNGAQQTRLNQAINSLPEMLDTVDALSAKWKGGRFPILNKANLTLAKGGAYGPDVASVANQLDAQIADITADLGNVYMGGNSPTDHALGLAAKSLSADWDQKVLKDMTALARKNVQVRLNSIRNTGVQGASAGNPYAPAPVSAAPAAATRAPAAPAGWKYVPKPGGGWTAVEDK